jgi:hypothetical protein
MDWTGVLDCSPRTGDNQSSPEPYSEPISDAKLRWITTTDLVQVTVDPGIQLGHLGVQMDLCRWTRLPPVS